MLARIDNEGYACINRDFTFGADDKQFGELFKFENNINKIASLQKSEIIKKFAIGSNPYYLFNNTKDSDPIVSKAGIGFYFDLVVTKLFVGIFYTDNSYCRVFKESGSTMNVKFPDLTELGLYMTDVSNMIGCLPTRFMNVGKYKYLYFKPIESNPDNFLGLARAKYSFMQGQTIAGLWDFDPSSFPVRPWPRCVKGCTSLFLSNEPFNIPPTIDSSSGIVLNSVKRNSAITVMKSISNGEHITDDFKWCTTVPLPSDDSNTLSFTEKVVVKNLKTGDLLDLDSKPIVPDMIYFSFDDATGCKDEITAWINDENSALHFTYFESTLDTVNEAYSTYALEVEKAKLEAARTIETKLLAISTECNTVAEECKLSSDVECNVALTVPDDIAASNLGNLSTLRCEDLSLRVASDVLSYPTLKREIATDDGSTSSEVITNINTITTDLRNVKNVMKVVNGKDIPEFESLDASAKSQLDNVQFAIADKSRAAKIQEKVVNKIKTSVAKSLQATFNETLQGLKNLANPESYSFSISYKDRDYDEDDGSVDHWYKRVGDYHWYWFLKKEWEEKSRYPLYHDGPTNDDQVKDQTVDGVTYKVNPISAKEFKDFGGTSVNQRTSFDNFRFVVNKSNCYVSGTQLHISVNIAVDFYYYMVLTRANCIGASTFESAIKKMVKQACSDRGFSCKYRGPTPTAVIGETKIASNWLQTFLNYITSSYHTDGGEWYERSLPQFRFDISKQLDIVVELPDVSTIYSRYDETIEPSATVVTDDIIDHWKNSVSIIAAAGINVAKLKYLTTLAGIISIANFAGTGMVDGKMLDMNSALWVTKQLTKTGYVDTTATTLKTFLELIKSGKEDSVSNSTWSALLAKASSLKDEVTGDYYTYGEVITLLLNQLYDVSAVSNSDYHLFGSKAVNDLQPNGINKTLIGVYANL